MSVIRSIATRAWSVEEILRVAREHYRSPSLLRDIEAAAIEASVHSYDDAIALFAAVKSRRRAKPLRSRDDDRAARRVLELAGRRRVSTKLRALLVDELASSREPDDAEGAVAFVDQAIATLQRRELARALDERRQARDRLHRARRPKHPGELAACAACEEQLDDVLCDRGVPSECS